MRAAAALVSFLVPGGGQAALLGRPGRAAVWIVLGLAGLVLLPWFPLAGAVTFASVRVVSAIDAALAEKRAASPAAFAIGLVAALVAAIGGPVAARVFWVRPLRVASGSMAPALLAGDHVFVWPPARSPARGDVIELLYPVNRRQLFVKRVVGLGGDSIRIAGGVVSVNGRPLAGDAGGGFSFFGCAEENAWPCGDLERLRAGCGAGQGGPCVPPDAVAADWDAGRYVVPRGEVFVLGDARANSHDSRYFGAVPLADVRGTVTSIWWSREPARIGQRVR